MLPQKANDKTTAFCVCDKAVLGLNQNGAVIVGTTCPHFEEPYILFEAGAILKAVERSLVCTLLIGIEPSDVTGPRASAGNEND